MSNLINIIEALEDENKESKYTYFRKKKKQYEWLKIENFLEWIKTAKIIDYVYGEYSHPEIIRKSGELLEKMCQYRLFTNHEIDIIWTIFEGNYHEDIVRATLDVIEIVVKECDEDILDNIRNRVHKLKKTDYDVPMINFMKNFILAETSNFYKIDSNKKNSGVKAIKKLIYMGSQDADSVLAKEHIDLINKDIEILWKLPTQKGLAENAKAAAAKAIPEILSSELCSDKTKEKYIELSKKSLKSGVQIYTNL